MRRLQVGLQFYGKERGVRLRKAMRGETFDTSLTITVISDKRVCELNARKMNQI